eukprot:1112038-Amphidinium_carterae.1
MCCYACSKLGTQELSLESITACCFCHPSSVLYDTIFGTFIALRMCHARSKILVKLSAAHARRLTISPMRMILCSIRAESAESSRLLQTDTCHRRVVVIVYIKCDSAALQRKIQLAVMYVKAALPLILIVSALARG